MAQQLRITIPGKPRPWARPSGHGGGYVKDRSLTEHMETIAEYIFAATRQKLWAPDAALEVDTQFIFEGRRQGETIIVLRQAPEYGPFDLRWRDRSPDIDNLAKMVLEGVQHSKAIQDDKQIVKLVAAKVDRRAAR